MRVYTTVGTTDERTDCDCCGRSNLKMTVVLQDNETREFVFFGTACAAKAAGWTVKEVKARVKQANQDATAAAQAFLEAHPLRVELDAAWAELTAWNDAHAYTVPRTTHAEREEQPCYKAVDRLTDWIQRDVCERFPPKFRNHVYVTHISC